MNQFEKESFEEYCRRYLHEEWSVDPDAPWLQLAAALKMGRVNEINGRTDPWPTVTESQKRLVDWARAWAAFYGFGPRAQQTADAMVTLLTHLQKPSTPGYAHILSLLIHYTAKTSHSIVQDSDISSLLGVARAIADNVETTPLSRAECLFALGIYGNSTSTDTVSALRYYERAADAYRQARAYFDEDRLYNTWGHLLTLTFSLQRARTLLEHSHRIKEEKGDQVGLAFSYGCLADVCARSGEFDRAIRYYGRDLEICRQTGMGHFVPGLKSKIALSRYRQGIVQNDMETIVEARRISQTLAPPTESGPTRDLSGFFALKEQVKCLLAEHRLSGSRFTDSIALDTGLIGSLLGRMDAFLPRENPPAYFCALYERLRGRYQGFRGEYHEAIPALRHAAKQFTPGESDGLSELYLENRLCTLEQALFTFLSSGNAQSLKAIARELYSLAEGERELGSAGQFLRQELSMLVRPPLSIRLFRGARNDAWTRSVYRVIGFFES